MLVDERERNTRHLRGMLNQAAEAIGRAGDRGIAEGSGLALDIMGGAEQFVVRLFVEAVALDVLTRRFQPFAFGMHPAGEFGGKLRQGLFGACDRIVMRIHQPAPTTLRNGFSGVITSWSAKVATAGASSLLLAIANRS